MKKIAVIGACGRMGRAIIQVLNETPDAELSHAVDRGGSVFIGLDSGIHSGLPDNGVLFTESIEDAVKEADAVIDFSISHNVAITVAACIQYKKPVVIGVTGLTENEKDAIGQAAAVVPVVYSPNMSVGVNLLFKLTEIAAEVMGRGSNIEILDIHHKHKKDSPSGTAVKLKEILLNTLKRTEKDVIYGREGIYEKRPENEIAVHSMRAGEVIGEHTVKFFTPEERIEIAHRAEDRKTFAVGAVRAAMFAVKQKKGLYDMFNVLGF